MQSKIYEIYKLLFKTYGAQGWWPFIGYDEMYHPLDYTYPKSELEVFEVCLGSILTQNTTFNSVLKSLHNLKKLDALSPKAIKNLDLDEFKLAIRPSGYYNQKAKYILEFIDFYQNLESRTPSRDELLRVLGIGEETADSILLFGYNKAEFKVDAYTKRFLLSLGFIDAKAKYRDIKELMQSSLKELIKDEKELVITYQEYHALIVNHSKKLSSKNVPTSLRYNFSKN